MAARESGTPKLIAFMAMPFRTRKVPRDWKDAPRELDCNRLWNAALQPALEDLGYVAIRADMEVGTVIVKDMLDRLAFADLVVADLTLPNGNVYYEAGIRHVAQKSHCILIAAEWSKQLFDVDQMRTHRYALKDGSVPDAEAAVIREWLQTIVSTHRESPTPFHEYVKGKQQSTVFRKQVEEISAFQARIRVVQLAPDRKQKEDRVRALLAETGPAVLEIPEVALELLMMVRDALSWEEFQKYAGGLPDTLRRDPFAQEQALLAQSKVGNHEKAIAGLEQLIERHGETPERRGLLGGRYKRLWRAARDQRRSKGEPGIREKADLTRAIEEYRRGMLLDFNEYFCLSNLPLLLRFRGEVGDFEESGFLDAVLERTCNRRLKLGETDGWQMPALLGVAFRCGDVDMARQRAALVAAEGPAAWRLETTLEDLRDAIDTTPESTGRRDLDAVLQDLRSLLPQPAGTD